MCSGSPNDSEPAMGLFECSGSRSVFEGRKKLGVFLMTPTQPIVLRIDRSCAGMVFPSILGAVPFSDP